MSEIKSYPVNSDKLKNNVLFCALQKFYDQCPSDDKQMFLDIINGKSKMSLRIIDWFITNYTKKFNIIYYLPKKKRSVKSMCCGAFSTRWSYNKANFDPFCRNDRITGWGDDGDIVTTIGQLNFFRWAIENRVLEYINNNLEDIEIDMNTNIKKNLKKNKKSLKSKKEGGKQPEQEVVNNSDSEAVIESDKVSEIKSLKKKRRELSKCATKTLNKHRGAIVLDFN